MGLDNIGMATGKTIDNVRTTIHTQPPVTPLPPTTIHALQPPVNGHSHIIMFMHQNLLWMASPTYYWSCTRTSCEQPLPSTVLLFMHQNLLWTATLIYSTTVHAPESPVNSHSHLLLFIHRTYCEQPLPPTTVHAPEPPVNSHSHLLLFMQQHLMWTATPTYYCSYTRASCEQPLPPTTFHAL